MLVVGKCKERRGSRMSSGRGVSKVGFGEVEVEGGGRKGWKSSDSFGKPLFALMPLRGDSSVVRTPSAPTLRPHPHSLTLSPQAQLVVAYDC